MEFEVTNSMITASKLGDRVVIRVLREALNDEDVKLCLNVFADFMNHHLKPNEKVRVLVEAQIGVQVKNVKKSIVDAFIKHFKENLKIYESHLNKCSLVVSDVPLSIMFSAVVLVIIKDSSRILVTHKLERAKEFLKQPTA